MLRTSILALALLLTCSALISCSSAPKSPDLLPSDGSAWNHNYVIIHPTQPTERGEKSVVYPPCPCPSQPQIPSTSVQPEDCSRLVDDAGCCPDGACGVPAPEGLEGEVGPLPPIAPAPAGVSQDVYEAGLTPVDPPLPTWLVIMLLGTGIVMLGTLWLMLQKRPRSTALVAAAVLAAFLLGGCSTTPFEVNEFATTDYVDQQADALRNGLATVATKDDIAKVDGELSAARAAVTEAGGLDLAELLAILFGGGGVGALIVRFLRGSSFQSGSGRKKKGAAVVAEKLDQKEQAEIQVAATPAS